MNEDTKSLLMEAFIKYAVPILFPALAALVAWVLVALRKKLEAQAQESKIAAVGAKVAHFGEVVTRELEATLKPELKAATADGKLTPEEYKKLRDIAMARLKSLLAEQGLQELEGVLGIGAGALDGYLGGIIERAVAAIPSESLGNSPGGASGVIPLPSLPGGMPTPPPG